MDGIDKDFYTYAGGDVYIPVTQLDVISKLGAAEDSASPALKLGAPTGQKPSRRQGCGEGLCKAADCAALKGCTPGLYVFPGLPVAKGV